MTFLLIYALGAKCVGVSGFNLYHDIPSLTKAYLLCCLIVLYEHNKVLGMVRSFQKKLSA